MEQQPLRYPQGFDPETMTARVAELAERSRKLFEAFVERQAEGDDFRVPDPRIINDAFSKLAEAMFANPTVLIDAHLSYWQQMNELWHGQMRRMLGEQVPPVVEPARADKRFKDDAWSEDLVFDYIKQSYLLTAEWIQGTVAKVDGLDEPTRRKVEFYTKQYVDAIAPTNFALTNPKVLRHAAETNGNSLFEGFKRLLEDLERGRGDLKITMTDVEAFVVGDNIAATPGKVVFENELMQLIQYTPSTPQVHKRPLLIIPPWINKYYILDLRAKNSFVRWAVSQGLTLFVVSWVNPDARLAEKTFEDYLRQGPLAAMDAIEQQTGERELLLIGYCLGGTLTACLLAWLKAKKDARVRAVTFFTTMLDFAEPGELSVFIDDEQLKLLDSHMQKKGYLEARHMQQVFNMMRANDLIWSFVVNNYLMGREPLAFDLLYWNSDSTRMPYRMHSFYLHAMYRDNLLTKPGAISLLGVPIDLASVDVPAYFLSTKDDHIAPWASTYASSLLLGGTVRFVLGGSGHIAGVINPADSRKYGYWTGPARRASAEDWLSQANQHEGSWWPDWYAWLRHFAGDFVEARDPAAGPLPVIEEAPGRYVRVRADD